MNKKIINNTKKLITGLDKEFRNSYRLGLKMINNKPMTSRINWFKFLSIQFRNQKILDGFKRRDFESIEYQLRRIKNQIELYSSPSIRNVQIPPHSDPHPNHYYLGWFAKGGKRGLGR